MDSPAPQAKTERCPSRIGDPHFFQNYTHASKRCYHCGLVVTKTQAPPPTPDLDAMVEEFIGLYGTCKCGRFNERNIRRFAAKVALEELTSMLDRVGRLDAEVHDALDERIAQLRRMAGE